MRYASSWFAPLFAIALGAALLAPSTAAAQPAVDELSIDGAELGGGGMSTIAVVGVTGYDQLMTEVGFIGGLAGRPEAADMVNGLIAMFTQGKGLVGLDKTRPWGVVLQTDGAQFVPVVCLPITDLDAILTLLVNFQIDSEEIGGGVYEITGPDQVLYAKQSGEWVYVGQSEESLDSAPADPTKVLADLVDDYDFGARVLVQNVPELFKQMAIGQLRAGLEAGLQQADDESDEDFARRREVAENQVQQITDSINDLDELTLGWSIDAETETTHLDMALTAVPGSDAASQFAALQDCKTRFSGFVSPDAAVLVRASTVTPPEQIEQQRDQVTQAIQQAKSQLATEIENSEDLPDDETRETLKLVMEDLFEVAEAMALSGVIDLAISADVSAERISVIGALAAEKTDKVEAALRKLDTLAKEQAGGEFPGVAWDAATHGGATFHTLAVPVPADKPEAAQALGSELTLAVGIGEGVVYFAAGKESMDRVTQAIDASQAAGEISTTPFEAVLSMSDLMQFAKAMNVDSENAAVTGMIADLLADAGDQDHIRLSVEPLGAGARYRLKIEKGVLKALGASAAAAQQAVQPGF